VTLIFISPQVPSVTDESALCPDVRESEGFIVGDRRLLPLRKVGESLVRGM